MNLPYELAKELKDAGFPQADLGGFNHTDDLNYPTLSELIEACGEEFYSIVRMGTAGFKAFSAVEDNEISTATAPTPEEAVARLWLALRAV